jgi:serine protease inhibitor
VGVRELFDENKADLSGIYEDNDKKGMYVDGILHKAFAEVNEFGSEAAAATGNAAWLIIRDFLVSNAFLVILDLTIYNPYF